MLTVEHVYVLLQLSYYSNRQLWEWKGIFFNSHMEGMTKVLERDPDIDLRLLLLWSVLIHFIVIVIVIKTIYNLTFHLIWGV